MPGFMLGSILAGVLSGLMIAAVGYAGLAAIPLALLGILPTYVVGLSKGLTPALYALGAGVVSAALIGDLGLGLNYLVLFALPQAWLIRQALLSHATAQATEWYPAGHLLAWIAAIAAMGLTAATLAFSGTEGGLVGALRQDFESAFRSLAAYQGWQLTEDQITHMAVTGATVLPVAMANLWMLAMVVNGLLAQVLVARVGRNLRPTPSFADLELPPALVYCLGAALLLSFFPDPPGFLGKELVAILLAPYLILGLAMLHAIARSSPARPVLLTATYFLLLVLPWLAVPFAILGLAEQVFGLRKRFRAAPDGREEE